MKAIWEKNQPQYLNTLQQQLVLSKGEMQFPIAPLFPLFLSENSQWSVHPTFKWSSQGPGNLRSQAGLSFLYPKCLQFFCLTWSFKARLKSVILLHLVFHFIIYWVLILSSPPCTKTSLWPAKHQRQVWPVRCNKSGARSRWRRVRKHTKVILQLHLWYMVYSKDFWPHSTGICFQSLQQWQQQKGAKGERMWAGVGTI